MSDEKRNADDRVSNFYEGKSVLITGAAGFVGVVILEILLRCCPGIKKIYILLREKKGVKPEKRKETLFQRKLFQHLHQKQPEVFNKVRVVAGDVAKPYLGLDEEDTQKLIEDVSIVFHCAATISFLKPLKFILMNNLAATNSIIELCKKMKKIDALVYTSTAYSNCNRKVQIEERVYRLPFPAERFLKELNNDNDHALEEIISECQPPWPNVYALSKCITENLILEKAEGVPTAIIRPALICQAFKGPAAGYVEVNSSLAQLTIGIGKGFLRVVEADPNARFDLIPVDVVANAHIVAAKIQGTKRSSSPLIINCSSSAAEFYSLQSYITSFCEFTKKHPLPNVFRHPTSCTVQQNTFYKEVMSFIEHYIPAIGLDLVLKLRGKKIRLVPAYRLLDKAMKTTKFFVLNSWKYDTENFKSLEKSLTEEDRETFNTCIKGLNIDDFIALLHANAPFYDWQVDKKLKQERVRAAKQIFFFCRCIQVAVIVLPCLAIYSLVSHMF